MMSKVTDFIQNQISEGLYPGGEFSPFSAGEMARVLPGNH
ncbi:Uncharacterised protein [Streptococcus pseudoporcinus]|uniref:Uncharacterized protein n=1 Tax=Streptococcus pseudoporcinus TaxID=361101 RepID=A0A4U9XMQ5_9STRE|nr:Uncharacterised protein [Streptococcus pseudoporcinus]